MPRSTGSSLDLSPSDARQDTGATTAAGPRNATPDAAKSDASGRWLAQYRGKEVIARPIGFFFREFERLGLATDLLLADVTLTREQLTSRHGRIDWDTMRTVMRNVGRVWDDEQLVAAGKRLTASNWVQPFALVARLLFSADELYRWNFRPMTGGSAQFFTCIENKLTQLGPGRITVETWMAPGYEPAPELYRMFCGSLMQMPRMVGLKQATVEMRDTQDGIVHFHVDYPTGGGVLSRLRRALTWPFMARSTARELDEANNLLFERYGELAQQTRERAQAMAALRESDERFRTAFNASPTLMSLTTCDGRMISVNEQFAQLCGYSIAELLGRRTSDINLWKHPEKRDEIYASLKKGDIVKGIEVELVNRNGDHRTALLSVHATSAGQEPCLIWNAVEITDRKKAEKENRLLQERIVQAQKRESLGVMAGGIAHDFNNLLVGILGNAELALSELANGSDATRERIEAIQLASQRAADLAAEMLAYAGQAKQASEPIELSALVDETATLLRSGVPKGVQLECRFAEVPVWVQGDPTQVGQVVMNLITNAAESFGNAAGHVDIRTGIVDADEDFFDTADTDDDLPPGRYAMLEVADSGCGMDADTIKRIFDPFFTTKFTGRGLGLAATLGIVRGHSGTLRVRSEAGSGTHFQVFLPLTDERPRAQPEIESESKTGGKVLVVDDEQIVRDVAVTMLRNLGHEAIGAESGEQALALLPQIGDRLTAVVLDLTMPGMSGDETFHALRERYPELPVLCCSGHGAATGSDWLKHKRRVGFIAKPFRLNDLERAISSLIDS